MGASQSAIQVPVEEGLFPETGYSLADAIETDSLLKRYGYTIETSLPAGSGRMMKTFQLRRKGVGGGGASNARTADPNHHHHLTAESTAVLKAAWILEQAEPVVSNDVSSAPTFRQSSWLEEQLRELRRIRKAVCHQPHVAPFTAFFLSDSVRAAPRNVLQSRAAATARFFSSSSSHGAAPPVQVRAAYILRPAVYTTLADRLASRPWLSLAEKLWITSQILQALQELHASGVVHGFLTTENVGLTSTGWVVLLDIASYKARTALPDDDPSEYLYYFQPASSNSTQPHQNDRRSSNEKRCYLAPERFCTLSSESKNAAPSGPPLTPAMDIFSTGCVLTELFLNGERCLDLGDLMEYRKMNADNNTNNNAAAKKNNVLTVALQQKLNKIESSAVRAACKHMLAVDPAKRLSAAEYWERLQAANQFPPSFPLLTEIAERITTGKNGHNNNDFSFDSSVILTPDARIAVAAAEYGRVLWETIGIRDAAGEAYFRKVLGPTMAAQQKADGSNTTVEEKKTSTPDEAPFGSTLRNKQLFTEVEALLKDLDSVLLGDGVDETVTSSKGRTSSALSCVNDSAETMEQVQVERRALCKSTLLIFLQFILSTVRHAQRPASKLVALQLIDRLSRYSSDEARLQRIVSVAVSLLQDQDPLVRASAVHVLTSTLATIEKFPPSDSKIFPQYIFKRVAHMISDPALVVRLTFARCIAVLAETAHRFLDISHAVRLYEAVGNGTSGSVSRDEMIRGDEKDAAVFGDEVARLLDTESRVSSRVSLTSEQTEGAVETASIQSEGASVAAGKTLISSTYNAELAALHETVSRWVVHVTTDQSEHSSLPKRAILNDLSRLCAFFGLEGVMSFILPQILAFLNERRDWELRASLFEHLPSVCHSIGRAATEEFVLPYIEIGLVDSEERVICHSLSCLSRIAAVGLLSRSALLGNGPRDPRIGGPALLRKYGALLLHPSVVIRRRAVVSFATISKNIGPPDCDVYVIPLLRPFFRFHPASYYLNTADGMMRCLKPAWTREKLNETLNEIATLEKNGLWTSGAWTSIGVMMTDDNEKVTSTTDKSTPFNDDDPLKEDSEDFCIREYLRMLVRHTTQSSVQDRSLLEKSSTGLLNGIEGSAKLAQSIMFPRQNGWCSKKYLPEWYGSLRDTVENSNIFEVSEAVSIRSVSTLGHIYGLSIMGPVEGATENIVGAADDSHSTEAIAQNVLRSTESKHIEAAFGGEWGSEAILDPDIVDTSLLVTKLKALSVPPLPMNFGDPLSTSHILRGPSVKDSSVSNDWKPRFNSLMATSSLTHGHTAPVMRLAVSVDQTFFVSASHDGTCRVWEVPQMDESTGQLESSITYAEHSVERPTRINDVAMLEGTYSVVSGDSGGCVNVWRVDMITSSGQNLQTDQVRSQERSRVVGSTSTRSANPREGEILAVSHFNSSSASVVTFATQQGVVHSWDLRCATEPFKLHQSPEFGHLTGMALGSDRHWIVTGTSKGFVALWDIRFQQCVKLWRHSRGAPISRMATSTVPPPQHWGSPLSSSSARPFIFAAAGANECAMFEVLSGSCTECFRTVAGDSRNFNSHVEDPPRLVDIPIYASSRFGMLKPQNPQNGSKYVAPVASINCMVGSIGANHHSYLITGGSDSRIRFWDFSVPSKCYVMSGQSQMQSRPSFERIDFEGQRRLMLCRQSQGLRDSGKLPRKIFHGVKKPEQHHTDSIQDIKVLDNCALVSCSRDCTVKVWR